MTTMIYILLTGILFLCSAMSSQLMPRAHRGLNASTQEDALFVALSKDISGAVNPVKFDRVDVDVQKSYDKNGGKFYAKNGGAYWVSLSEGIKYNGDAAMFLWRDSVKVCSVWRNAHGLYKNGVNTLSRDIILNVENKQSIYTSSPWSTGFHSDDGAQTSLTLFRLTDLMNTSIHFSATRRKPVTAAEDDMIPFDHVLVNEGNSFVFTLYFEAPRDGLYYFSYSLAVEHAPFYTSLRRNGELLGTLSRNYNLDDYTDTVTRAGIYQLNKGDVVYVNADRPLTLNNRYPDEYLTSLSGFLYEPKHRHKIAWSVAKQTSWSGDRSLVPFPFEEVIVNEGQGWNRQRNRFVAPVTGLYYITLTAGSQPKKGVHLGVYVDLERKFGLKRLSTLHTGNDISCRSAIINVQEGDAIYVGVEGNTAIYSKMFHRETTFSGFLLFPYQ